jgi:class 3 adenylate cyclase
MSQNRQFRKLCFLCFLHKHEVVAFMAEGLAKTATETRQLAAIMFTDIVDFSRQMGTGEARMLRLLEVHNQVIQQAVAGCSIASPDPFPPFRSRQRSAAPLNWLVIEPAEETALAYRRLRHCLPYPIRP